MIWKVASGVALVCLLPALFIQRSTGAETLTLDDITQAVQESLPEDFNWSALPALTELDEAQLQAVCRELQKRFQGEYVLELAPLAKIARHILPLLDKHEETQPYAAWLRVRVDDLDVAEELRLLIPPLPETAIAPVPPVNPTPAIERRVWHQHLQQQPASPAAQRLAVRLKPVFTAEGVPPELIWLAEVESGFDARARSPAGAAGLFQLMPATARWLGLGLWPGDDRFHPLKSARAAARYLNYLHGKFADWPLTVAAYNAGEGRVGQLLAQHHAHSFDAIATELPAETQMYVPRVENIILVREGVALADLKPATVRN